MLTTCGKYNNILVPTALLLVMLCVASIFAGQVVFTLLWFSEKLLLLVLLLVLLLLVVVLLLKSFVL